MFVYFIQAGTSKGPIKIGYASDVEKRISDLQVGCPFTLTILFKLPARSLSHARMLEGWFHDRYYRKRIHGEWFKAIPLNRIQGTVRLAMKERDWNQVRIRPDVVRPLNEIEKTNQQRADEYAASNFEAKITKQRIGESNGD